MNVKQREVFLFHAALKKGEEDSGVKTSLKWRCLLSYREGMVYHVH